MDHFHSVLLEINMLVLCRRERRKKLQKNHSSPEMAIRLSGSTAWPLSSIKTWEKCPGGNSAEANLIKRYTKFLNTCRNILLPRKHYLPQAPSSMCANGLFPLNDMKILCIKINKISPTPYLPFKGSTHFFPTSHVVKNSENCDPWSSCSNHTEER